MTVYHYDMNMIFMEPMKNKTAQAMEDAFTIVHNKVKKAGFAIKHHILDNECPQQLRDYFKREKIEFQLVPPGMKRRNAAERAIRTGKNHLIAGLSSCPPEFPLHLWCRLIFQAELTLNLMRGSRANPKLSAWAQCNGQYNFNAHPIAPPGIPVIAHTKPGERGSWATHGVEGFYVGPSL